MMHENFQQVDRSHLTLSPLCPWLLNGPCTPNYLHPPFVFTQSGTLNPDAESDILASSRTRQTYNLPRGSSSLSAHKTSTSALAPPKFTTHALAKQAPTSSTKKRKKDLVIATEKEPDDASAGPKRSTKKAKLGLYDGNDAGSTSAMKLKTEKKKKTKELMPEAKGKSAEKEAVIDKKGKNKQASKPVASGGENEEDSEQNPSSSDSEDDDGEYVPPVHESLATAAAPDSTPSSKKNKKYVPPGETPDQRDSRTIFVGNVPSQVMTTKVSRHPRYPSETSVD